MCFTSDSFDYITSNGVHFFRTIMCKITWTLHVKVWTLASLYEKLYFYFHECKTIITHGF